MTRRGFTLLELLVSIVVTSVVALLVYGAADAGFTTRGRLDRQRRELQTGRAVRALLHEALRNARPATRADDGAFVLEDRRDARGRPADRLTFVASGGFPPLTDDSQWTVSVELGDSGVTISAEPRGVRGARSRQLARVAGATGVNVRVREMNGSAWAERWEYLSIVPAGVEVTFTSDSGVIGVPLRVALPLGGAP